MLLFCKIIPLIICNITVPVQVLVFRTVMLMIKVHVIVTLNDNYCKYWYI